MFDDFLDRRFDVKQLLKFTKQARLSNLAILFDCRQQALKLICNTTYGFMSANFSGYMPSPIIGDAVVGTGRKTLDYAIKVCNSKDSCEVKYGDTDSVFVNIKTESMDPDLDSTHSLNQISQSNRIKAFMHSYSLVHEINLKLVSPCRLKFEKVYQPCILASKKRYLGLKFESELDAKCKLEFKGTENIRKDFTLGSGQMLSLVIENYFSREETRINKKGRQENIFLTEDCQKFIQILIDSYTGFDDLRNFAISRKIHNHNNPNALTLADSFENILRQQKMKELLNQNENLSSKGEKFQQDPHYLIPSEKRCQIFVQKRVRKNIVSGEQSQCINEESNENDICRFGTISNSTNYVSTINKRLMTEKEIIYIRRQGIKAELDLPYYFWSQNMPGLLRSLGLHDQFLWIEKIKGLQDDGLMLPPIKKDLMNINCKKCFAGNTLVQKLDMNETKFSDDISHSEGEAFHSESSINLEQELGKQNRSSNNKKYASCYNLHCPVNFKIDFSL